METYCDPSLESSWHQLILMRVLLYGFMQKYGESSLDYPCYPFLSGALVDYLHVLAQQK